MSMGAVFSGRAEGGHEREREGWPDLSVTWSYYQERRASPDSPPSDSTNGFYFCNVLLPDTVVEIILSLVDPKDVLNCNLVCGNWKDIITRKSYWRKWFVRKGWRWDMIPQSVRDKETAWIVFYAQVKHEIFTKNFISNHSGCGEAGRTEYRDWEIFGHVRDETRWIVESPPTGCDPLPPDPLFEGEPDSAWVTSYTKSSKWTMVNLWREGLTPAVMITSVPFTIECSQMYTVRFDCGGIFFWTLRTLDKQEQVIDEYSNRYELGPQRSWEKASHSFHFDNGHLDNINELKSLVFVHEGKDNQFWAGHYGTKFARSCVRFRCDETKESIEEMQNSASERKANLK